MNMIMWSAEPSLLLSLTLLLSLSVEPSEQVRTSLYREWQTAQPLLKIGYAEKPLKIDPPLITVCLKYLSARATFKHYSLSLGFYIAMEIPKSCSEFILLPFSTWTYSVHIPLPDIRGLKKYNIYSWLCCFFPFVLTLLPLWQSCISLCAWNLSIYVWLNAKQLYFFDLPLLSVLLNVFQWNTIILMFNDHTSMAGSVIDVWWESFSKVLVTLTVWSLVFSAATLIQGDSITTT